MNRKHVFWQALLSAILIFGVGIILGISFENARTRGVEVNLLNSEINVLDSTLLSQVGQEFEIGCSESREALLNFADKIYEEASLLEDYDESSQLIGTLRVIHKKYDLLRMILWMNSINLRERCGDNFYTFVYFFDYDEPSVEQDSTQEVFAKVLESLKSKYGADVLLIPIAGDLELSSVEIILQKYGIENLPAVVMNEKEVADDLLELREMQLRVIDMLG